VHLCARGMKPIGPKTYSHFDVLSFALLKEVRKTDLYFAWSFNFRSACTFQVHFIPKRFSAELHSAGHRHSVANSKDNFLININNLITVNTPEVFVGRPENVLFTVIVLFDFVSNFTKNVFGFPLKYENNTLHPPPLPRDNFSQKSSEP